MTIKAQTYDRESGDDQLIQLRVRRANLPVMERGLNFHHARITFVRRLDDTYDMLVEGYGPPPEVTDPAEAIGHPDPPPRRPAA